VTKKRKGRKILLWILIPLLILAMGGGAAWYFLGRSTGETVYVYPFTYMGMTEYWGDQQESYGPVSTSQIQTVFLSSTQTVTNVFVSQGDAVKKGDVLMSFDTTLTDIALERERLKVEKLKLELEDAQKELRRINAMKPMQEPKPPEEEPEEEEKLPTTILTKAGDTWNLGEHRLIIGEDDAIMDDVVNNYVYQTGNMSCTCVRDGKEYEYMELVSAWAAENDITDDVFRLRKPKSKRK
jgi:flagellar basal body-associated protein FliL